MSPRPIRALVVAAVAAALTTTGCTTHSNSADDDGKTWSYQSGNGETVTVDHTPTRIIAQTDTAAALLDFGIRPVGIFGNEDPADNKNLDGVDLTGIEVLGTEWGVMDVQATAALNPDLIVTDWWPAENSYGGFEESVAEETKQVLELAPAIGGAQGASLVELLKYYEGLAQSLGADLSDPTIADQKTSFDSAVTDFQAATAANEGLTAMAVSPATDLLYVAVPAQAAELVDFRDWGLDLVDPDSPDPGFPYWENLSWENADKYQPDLILIDDRTYPSNLDDAQDQPTWDSIRAVEAGAVVEWPCFWIHSYSSYTTQLVKLTEAIEQADPTIGD